MNKESSCEELLELINSLIDGELQGEMLQAAESLIRENPQCSAMFHTVSKTITLSNSGVPRGTSLHFCTWTNGVY